MSNNKLYKNLNLILEDAEKWVEAGGEYPRFCFNNAKKELLKEIKKLEEYKWKYKDLEK